MANQKEHDLHSIIRWFNSTESLLEDVLETIPYVPEHRDVWSPKLVTIILETCSQLDSLLKFRASQSAYVTQDRLDIGNYYEYFGESVAPKWVVFNDEKLFPFAVWGKSPSPFKRCDYPKHQLHWWDAYNKLKHNRIENQEEAKLIAAIEAMGGLFLAILDTEECRSIVATSGWLKSDSRNPACDLDDYLNQPPCEFTVAETLLFAYPAGWWKKTILKHWLWAGPASPRFRA